MPEPNQNVPATVPEQPKAKPPLRKSMPVVIALVVILGLIGIANLSSLLSGNRKNAPVSSMPMRPAAPNAQQVPDCNLPPKQKAMASSPSPYNASLGAQHHRRVDVHRTQRRRQRSQQRSAQQHSTRHSKH